MKKLLGIVVLCLFWFETGLTKPKVLECKKDCGTVDSNNEFSFQARFAMGSDKKGCNVTFIEDDIILTSAHCLGLGPEEKNIPCCDSETAKKKAKDLSDMSIGQKEKLEKKVDKKSYKPK